MSLKFVSEDKKRVENVDGLQNDIKPTENRVVLVENTSTGGSTFYAWNSDGSASQHDDEEFIESLVDGYKEGDANEGVWERAILPVDEATTDQLDEPASNPSNKYFTEARARDAVDTDIYESATRLYVDKEKGTDPAIDYDPSNYAVLPGRNEARAFETIGRAVEEIKENIRPTPSNGPDYVTETPQPIVISVAAGSYEIDNPISVPKRVSIQGDGLRTTLIDPQNPKADLFHVRSRTFFQLFRYKDHQHPSFCFSYPSVVVETLTGGTDSLTGANIIHSPYGYECDYDEVFTSRYPVVDSVGDRGDAVREGQLVSVDPPGDNDFVIYQSTADVPNPSGPSDYSWEPFADTNATSDPLQVNANRVIERLKPEVKISDPRGAETNAEAEIVINNGKVDQINITDSGSGYEFKPMVSIAAPVRKQPFIIGSPYLYNASSVTGPFTFPDSPGGERTEVPETMPLPFNLNPPGKDPISGEDIVNSVDENGAGGGTKIDGRVTFGNNKVSNNNPAYNSLPSSPLKSMVAAQFTQVNQGGPGHLLMNDAFGQYVSCFTTFSNYSYRCQSGGFALCSNSVTDFGNEGLVAEGKLDTPYTSGDVTSSKDSFVSKVEVIESGSGYDPSDTIDIEGPASGTSAELSLDVDSTTGEIISVTVTNQGDGYESEPSILKGGLTGSGAAFEVDMDKVINVEIENLDQTTSATGLTRTVSPIQGTAVEVGGKTRDVSGWTENPDGSYSVTFVPGVFSVSAGETIEFFQSSRINSSGHAFEFPGSGVTYNALPEYGGVTDGTQKVIEVGAGNVFVTANDQRGNFLVGNAFKVDQTTGTVTFETDQFNLSGLNAIGPFKVGGNEVGVQLQEVTNDDNLVSDSTQPQNTVPTVSALQSYLPSRIVDILEGDADDNQGNPIIEGELIDGDNIDVNVNPSGKFEFNFTGVQTETTNSSDTKIRQNDARVINFGDNLEVTNAYSYPSWDSSSSYSEGTVVSYNSDYYEANSAVSSGGSSPDSSGSWDEYNAQNRVLVDGPTDTDDLPEGTNNLYFTGDNSYSKLKDQLKAPNSFLSLNNVDADNDLEITYEGPVEETLTGQGVPDPATGDNKDLYVDVLSELREVELDQEEIRKVSQDIIQTPGKFISKQVDYKRNLIKIKLDIDKVASELP